MPHSTTSDASAPSRARASSILKPPREANGDPPEAPERFPDLVMLSSNGRPTSPSKPAGHANGSAAAAADERWFPRRGTQERALRWAGTDSPARSNGHARQKSLSDAIRDIRTRRGSVSQSAHEIADALKAPVSPRLIVGVFALS